MVLSLDNLVSQGLHGWATKETETWRNGDYWKTGGYFLLNRVASAAYLPVHITKLFMVPLAIAGTGMFCISDGIFSHPVRYKWLYLKYRLSSIPLCIIYGALSLVRNIFAVLVPEWAWGNQRLHHWFTRKFMVVDFLQAIHFIVRQDHWHMHQWFSQKRPALREIITANQLREFPLLSQRTKEDLFYEVLPKMKRKIEHISAEDLNELDHDIQMICLAEFIYFLTMQYNNYYVNPEAGFTHAPADLENMGLTPGTMSEFERKAYLKAVQWAQADMQKASEQYRETRQIEYRRVRTRENERPPR